MTCCVLDSLHTHTLSSLHVSLCLPQGYQFEEENPYLSHPDPLSEGVKRMEAGDIPGAVRFFESAVQREPDNQLVSFWFHLNFLQIL